MILTQHGIAARLGYSVPQPDDMSFFCSQCCGDVLVDLTVFLDFVRVYSVVERTLPHGSLNYSPEMSDGSSAWSSLDA